MKLLKILAFAIVVQLVFLGALSFFPVSIPEVCFSLVFLQTLTWWFIFLAWVGHDLFK